MGLSEYERTVLRRLDADLGRQDPGLRRRLTEFTAPPENASEDVSWRPPRAAVALAAVMLAAVTFMMVVIPLVMRQPCRPPATATGSQATAEPVAPSAPPTC
ncbi:DUF3040 domain-containing protein [Actinomadura sp. GC306]|uniref:DUF3040 domain-containing protein n=1 Tax=Actinomadura sp. GC306 TaxID=2530367 RepID=UPI001404FEE3|nr:DUF3040 domain-containing protein [Actinomadura sp. GC306]